MEVDKLDLGCAVEILFFVYILSQYISFASAGKYATSLRII